MTHHTSPHPGDLEPLLAAYVDGSAAPEDRAAVEAHLATCAGCREEVDLATSARHALESLPELEPPAMAREVAIKLGLEAPEPTLQAGEQAEEPIQLAGRGPAERAPRRRDLRRAHREDRLRERRARAGKVFWGAGAAAAAVLVGLGLYLAVIQAGGGGGQASGPAPPAATTVAPRAALGVPEYSPEDVNALADSLAEKYATEERAGESLVSTPSGTPADRAADAEGCLRAGGSLTSEAVLVHLVESATYQGVPAYIGGFVNQGDHPQLVVIVVSQDGCTPLYNVAEPL